MIIDSEGVDGDKSGTTVSNLSRASFKVNGTAAAASHSSGATIYFVSSFEAMKACFPTKIDESVLSGSVASVTFSSISQNFRNLQIITSARGDTAATGVDMIMQVNADAGANYINQQVYGNNNVAAATQSAAGTANPPIARIPGATATAAYAGMADIVIANYTSTTFVKNAIGKWTEFDTLAAANEYVGLRGWFWSPLNAITSVKLFPSAGNFVSGSVFTLYGLP